MEYREAIEALYARMPSRIGPSLERVEHLAEMLDHPERAAPAIHLTGTNGKTTTARIAGQLLAAFGVGAGIYTSPHLQDVRERIALASRRISPEEFAATWAYLEPFFRAVDGAHDHPVTFFEALTMLAFTWFAEVPVDAQVVEVGMGGTWDATNLVRGDVAVLTRIGVDHPELGSTPAEVAREKLGIIKAGAVVVSQQQEPEVLPLLEARVAEQGAELLLEGRDFGVEERQLAHGGQVLALRLPGGAVVSEVLLPLHGRHQAANAATALAAVAAFLGRRELDAEVVRAGFAAVTSPGRLEVAQRRPLVLLDGAHNPDGARALAAALREEFPAARRTTVLACLADKDVHGILRGLAPVTDRLIVTTNRNPRAASPERLAKEAEAVGLAAEAVADVPTAVRRAVAQAREDEVVVVTGSLYTVGEARVELLGEEEPPA